MTNLASEHLICVLLTCLTFQDMENPVSSALLG